LCHPDLFVRREPLRPLAAERLETEAGRSGQCQTDSQYFARLLTTGGKVFSSAQNSLQLQQRGPFNTLYDSRSTSTRCRLSADRHVFWYQFLADMAELLLTIILQTQFVEKRRPGHNARPFILILISYSFYLQASIMQSVWFPARTIIVTPEVSRSKA
jgi:hypothetical protein